MSDFLVMLLSSPLTAPVLASLLTFAFSIIAFKISYKKQRDNKKEDEKKQIEAFLNAIRSETLTIWRRYDENIGKTVENLQENEGFGYYYAIYDNYFIIYDNNTNLIGNLDKDLSAILIETYTAAKGLKDAFTFNNQLLNEVRRYKDLAAQETEMQHYKTQYETYSGIWQNAGTVIKETHLQVKQLKDELIKELDKRLDQR